MGNLVAIYTNSKDKNISVLNVPVSDRLKTKIRRQRLGKLASG